MRVGLVYDLGHPECWLALAGAETLAQQGVELDWIGVDRAALRLAVGAVDRPLDTPRGRAQRADWHRRAQLQGRPLRGPDHPTDCRAAMRWIQQAPLTRRAKLREALFRARWEEGLDLRRPSVLARVACQLGVVAPGPGRQSDGRQRLVASTRRAIDRGVVELPSWLLPGKPSRAGADRLPLVRADLGLAAAAPPPPGKCRRSLTFYHDFASPFSYLGSSVIERMAARQGARLQWRPILLGALFRQIGTPDVPMHMMSGREQEAIRRDLRDHAAWRGLPFRFPSTFPLRTVMALRVALLEPATTLAIYRAAWSEDRNIGDARVLASVLEEAGFPGEALVERTRDPAVKQQLRRATEAARIRGVFGVPTSDLGGVLLWGQDRLHLVERWLAGELEREDLRVPPAS